MRSHLSYWPYRSCSSLNHSMVWKMTPNTICWTIWEEQNQRIFRDLSCSSSKLEQDIGEALSLDICYPDGQQNPLPGLDF